MSRQRFIECRGSYGAVFVDATTGEVVGGSRESDTTPGKDEFGVPAEYADHARADLDECRQWHEAHGRKWASESRGLDITEVGWWLADGSYLAASENLRSIRDGAQ